MKKYSTLLIAIFVTLQLNAQFVELSEDAPNEAVHFDDAFYLQRAFESENNWTRGVLSSTILWDKSTNLWDINRALKSNNDFSMIRFVNGGSINFYVRGSTGNSNYMLTPNDLTDYKAMKIHSVGDVEILKNLGIGTATPSSLLHLESNDEPTITINNKKTGSDWALGESYGEILFNSKDGSGLGAGTRSYIKSITDHATGAHGTLVFGTRDNNELGERLRIDFNGNVGIGTSNPDELLTVAGNIHSQEVKVTIDAGTGPDYVFEENYNLRSLEETEAYIQTNKHLPEVPSAKEMEANGIQLGEMNMLLLKKIEELTLHTIEQQKLIEAQGKMIEELKSKIN